MRTYYVLRLILWTVYSVSSAHGGTKGDEADVIITQIMRNYVKEAHPNSKRDDGAVDVRIGITMLSISIVRIPSWSLLFPVWSFGL